MDDDQRQVWELSVELGPPEATGPGALDGEGVHPVALLPEESAQRIRGANRIPCFTAFGQVTALDEFAQRAWGDAYNQEDVPVECRLAVYVTDEELDDLTKAIVADLTVAAGDLDRQDLYGTGLHRCDLRARQTVFPI